jgi:hypothetical protein
VNTFITVMPMLGDIREERLMSLAGCHAILERRVTRRLESPSQMDRIIGEAIRELMLADRVKALDGNLQYIVRVEMR